MAHSYVTFGTSSVLMHDIEIVVTVWDLDLDRHLAAAADQARLRRLADAARAELEAEGDEVSGALLTRIVNAPGVFPILGNRPKAKLLADLDKLVGVLGRATASS